MSDVVIVGGGVIGLTAAWELAQQGAVVTLLDRAQPGHEASWAGAGMIPPGDPHDPAGNQLARMSAELWPGLSQTLEEQTGLQNGYLRCGSLQFSQDETIAGLQEVWQSLGTTAEVWETKRLREAQPVLNTRWQQAVFLPEFAQVRNPWHLRALLAACQRRGVNIVPDAGVIAWRMAGQHVQAARTEIGDFPGDQFLLSSGAWTSSLLPCNNTPPPIQPVRGQIALLRSPQVIFTQILEMGSRYLVPRADGRILIGSTEEHVGFDKGNTSAAVAELTQFAASLVPVLAEVPLERTWSGLRPWAVRGRPLIGRVPGSDNLFVAAGHFRAGLSNSLATAVLIRQLISRQELSIDLEPFAVEVLPT